MGIPTTGRFVMVFELGARKAVECLGLKLCRSLEEKNVGRDAEDGGLAYKVSEVSEDSGGHLIF